MRYVLHPGYVPSQTDRDMRYVSAHMLLDLHGVSPLESFVVVRDGPQPRGIERSDRDLGYREEPGDVHLRPRPRGGYPALGR